MILRLSKDLWKIFLISGVLVLHAEAASRPSLKPIHKVLVVALGKDAARATEIEGSVKHDFEEHGIQADSMRSLVGQSTSTVSELTERIRTQKYDSVLCMGPRKTIRVTAADKSGKFGSLASCLKSFVTGTFPGGEPLDVYPVVAEAPILRKTGAPDSLRTPIPTNPAAAPLTVFKGTLRLFDSDTEALIWEGSVHVKMPSELQGEFQTKVLAHEVWQVISESGVLPKP